MVVRGQLIAEGDPGRGEDGVGKEEGQRTREKDGKNHRFAGVFGQLPKRGENESGDHRSDENIWVPPPPT